MTEAFSEKIKKIRKLKGMTQQTVATVLRTSRSCIANYENGTREPDLKTVCRLAKLYGVSVEELMGGKTVRSIMAHYRRKESSEEAFYKQKTLDLKPLSTKSRVMILDVYNCLIHEEGDSAAEK